MTFIDTRFRAISGQPDEGDHWIGGPPLHPAAVCPVCKIPLLLLWDINTQDPRFPRLKWGERRRLPLYFCWHCVSDLAYRVVDASELEFFPVEYAGAAGNGPYPDYPSEFERTPLSLSASSVEELLSQLDGWDFETDPMGRTLSAEHGRRISEFLGHPATMALAIFHSQWGGPPSKMGWDSAVHRCPNPRCSSLGRLFRKKRMQFLAGILNDPAGGLPMVQSLESLQQESWNFFVSVEFQICPACGTVKGMNRSD
jgi:hypothetical protein